MDVTDCPTLTSLFTSSIAFSLKLLETLRIQDCSALKYIIADQRTGENENIIVQENDERDQKISDDSMFPKLKHITINSCNSLEWIFPLSFACDLEQLEDLRIRGASELKNIFGQYQHEDQPLYERAKEILPSLRIMHFSNIPKFISIFPIYGQPSDQPLQGINMESTAFMELHKLKYKNSEWLLPVATAQCLSKQLLNLCHLRRITLSSIPKIVSLFKLSTAQEMLLEYLGIEECHELKHIIATKEENRGDNNYDSVTVFPKLRTLVVRNCSLLKMVLPISFAHGLVQLESINLEEAHQLEYVFGHDDHLFHQIENEILIEFPALENLGLVKLPKMISVCSKNYHPTWPILKSVSLSECPQMRISSIIDCIIEKELHSSEHESSEWDHPVATTQCLSKQLSNLTHFSLLREIRLSSVPTLVSLFKVSTAQEMLLEHLEIAECHELKHIIENEEMDHGDNDYKSMTVFPKLRYLEVRNCKLLTMVLPLSLAHGLVQLESIELKEAPQLEYVFGHDDLSSHQIENDIEFPALTDLNLRKLPMMISICSKNYYPTWPILKSLTLSKCPLLKISSIIDCIGKKGSRENVIEGGQSRIEVKALEYMLNLENLKIKDDGELEGIFLHEGLPSSWQQTQLSSKLEDLRLKDLPSLRHICKTPLVLSFQNLEYLHVHGCGKLSYVLSACVLRNLPQLEELSVRDCDQLEQIVEDQEDHEVCFPTLKEIEIQRCNKLKSLFSVNTSNVFPKLRKLRIEEASQLEEVFRHKMCNVEDKLMLPSLSSLKLVKLPNLVGICHKFEVGTVKEFIVEDCPKFPSTSTAIVVAFPHEHQSAEEKGKETKEGVEEEIRGEERVAVKDRKAIEPNRDNDESREDRGKLPAKTVFTSNEGKDPETSTSHSEEEEKKEVQITIDENSDVAETNDASHHGKMKGPSEIVLTNLISEDDHPVLGEKEEKREVHVEISQTALTNPIEGRGIALQMTTKGHTDDECKEAQKQEKEEKIEVQMTAAQTTSSDENTPQMIEVRAEASRNVISSVEDYATLTDIGVITKHSDEKEGKEAKTERRLTANPMDGRDTAPHVTTKGRLDVVPDIPPTFFQTPSSETLLSSASLPPIHPLPSQVESSQEEYANFRDIGTIKKKHIPLLEEAIAKYPSLWAWRDQRFRRLKMIQVGYDILGDMLEFLASTRWRDLTEDKKAEFESLVYELETFGFDIQWLENSSAMVKQSRFDEETINHVQRLEAELMEQETEVEVLLNRVQMARAKVNKTKSELSAIRGEVGNFNDFIGF